MFWVGGLGHRPLISLLGMKKEGALLPFVLNFTESQNKLRRNPQGLLSLTSGCAQDLSIFRPHCHLVFLRSYCCRLKNFLLTREDLSTVNGKCKVF